MTPALGVCVSSSLTRFSFGAIALQQAGGSQLGADLDPLRQAQPPGDVVLMDVVWVPLGSDLNDASRTCDQRTSAI